MKRILTLAMAATFVLGTVCSASAVDVKIKGQWDFAFGWADNYKKFADQDAKNSKRNDDPFIARQRVRTQVDFIASEYLSGVLMFEIGDLNWGTAKNNSGRSSGGALDGDGVNIETKRAYLDWVVPNTGLAIRMGLQGLALPSATGFGNPVFNDDVAGVLASYKFNDMVSLATFWARPFDAFDNDSTADSKYYSGNKNLHDEMDMFGLILPLTFDGFKVTPWAVYSQIGGSSGFWEYRTTAPNQNSYAATNMFNDSVGAWWAGTAFELSLFKPLTFGMDVMYGDLHGNGDRTQNDNQSFGTRGWFIDANLNYKLDWGTPGLFGWWASGDNANDARDGRYGRMPVIGPDVGFAPTSFGFDGGTGISSDLAISRSGVGTWGIGAQIADMKFVENLSHTLRVAYYRGTNDSEILTNTNVNPAFLGEFNYMTDEDYAIEVNFDHKYQIYENLAAYLELGYIHLDLDEKWSQSSLRGNNDTSDAWKAQVLFQYKF